AEKMPKRRISPELASRILRTVASPEAFLFFTDIGLYTGEFAPCLADFLEKLEKIPLKSIEFHFERGDFEKWIRETLGDENLANMISKIGKSTRGEELRKTIQRMVERRLSQLEKIAETKSSPFLRLDA
ncbi:MAG: DUF5752 family protein, partial [Candidatus Thorarchaeota archaeon]